MLSTRGRGDADALGARLGETGDRLGLDEGLMPRLVLCSTAARTVETTERVLAHLSDPPPVSYLRSLYDASPDDVLKELAAVDDSIGSVMAVGHNPTFEVLVAVMPKTPVPELSGGFPTSGLAVFNLSGESWSDIGPRLADVLGVFHPPY
jgi:phosphohistidine phosphatase